MPNWVQNRLSISGSPVDIDRFVAVASTMTRKTRKDGPPVAKVGKGKAVEDNRSFCPEILAFQHFIPQPRKFPKSLPKGYPGTPRWMMWRAKYWGTKWDACWPEVKRVYGTRVRYWFSTPWDAPIEWLERISRKYPTLVFTLSYRRDGEWQQPCVFRGGNAERADSDGHLLNRIASS